MSEICQIEFENSPSKVVYSGQLLKGAVILNLRQSTFVQGVFLRITGKAFCKWSYGGKHSYDLTGTEKYLDERIKCHYDETAGADKMQIEAGTHRYPFECQLLSMIPTSVEEKYGNIRYTANVHFNEYWVQAPIHQENITVIKPLDLSLDFSLHEPHSMEKEKKFYICCLFPFCESDEMKVVARIPFRGFTPGQNINVELDIHNNSTEDVSTVLAQIVKEVTFYAKDNSEETRSDTITVSDTFEEGFNSIDTKSRLYKLNLVVPSTPPSDEKTSSIIKIRYTLRVIVLVGVCHNDYQFDFPITIGTYPIITQFAGSNVFLQPVASVQGTSGTQPPVVNQPTALTFDRIQVVHDGSLPSAPLLSTTKLANQADTTTAPAPTAPYPDPPTYEEAMHSDPDEPFRPKYPVYQGVTSHSAEN